MKEQTNDDVALINISNTDKMGQQPEDDVALIDISNTDKMGQQPEDDDSLIDNSLDEAEPPLYDEVEAANAESSRGTNVIKKPRSVVKIVIWLLIMGWHCLLSVFPIYIVVQGSQHLHDCPAEPRIPIYIIGGGLAAFLRYWILVVPPHIRKQMVTKLARICDGVLYCFMSIWLITGNYWMWQTWNSFQSENPLKKDLSYCHFDVYKYSYSITIYTCVYLAWEGFVRWVREAVSRNTRKAPLETVKTSSSDSVTTLDNIPEKVGTADVLAQDKQQQQKQQESLQEHKQQQEHQQQPENQQQPEHQQQQEHKQQQEHQQQPAHQQQPENRQQQQ